MFLIIKWLTMTTAIIISAYLLGGVHITIWGAIWVALSLGIINVTLKPILLILTLPINILTLGLFTLIINASFIILLSTIIKGFEVENFWWAVLFSLTLSIISYFLNKIIQ